MPRTPRKAKTSDDPKPTRESSPTPAVVPESDRQRRKRLLEEAKKKLTKTSLFVEHTLDEAVRWIVTGDQIGDEQGDGEVIGALIARASRLLSSLGGPAGFKSAVFGHSVTLEFQPLEDETKRAQKNLKEAERIMAEVGDNPTPEQEAEIEASLRAALPNVFIAGSMAADLIATRSDRAPEVAVSYGSGVANAYKTLATTVAKSKVTLTLQTPARDATKLTPTRAERIVAELKEASDPRHLTMTAFGVLDAARKSKHSFELQLDADATKHRVLKRKRVVRGTFGRGVEDQIMEEGLWGRQVKATLRVVRDEIVSTSQVRPMTFTLVKVERRQTS